MEIKKEEYANRIIEQCQALCQAYKGKEHQGAVKIARQLVQVLGEASSTHPELLEDKNVKAAQSIIRRYIRAQYIKPPKGLITYSGGAPGLGKR